MSHTDPCTLCPIGISDPSLCKGCAYNKEEKSEKPIITVTIVEIRF